jgi:hypothetical protein
MEKAIRIVINSRKLNVILNCHPFPISKIEYRDMIQSMEGFMLRSRLTNKEKRMKRRYKVALEKL